ncbi:MAG: bifunctional ADP-dependent NAD(P)H-hydrate dehydratase/NAD(P)H-hydrate epimerase, partial [Rubrivivax sp.]
PLEAARLLGQETARLQGDRLAAAREIATRFNATVVLKGSGTVVASPGARPAICSSGGPALATAGSGDVLAGLLGGLWAQQPACTAHAIACAGVEAHGRAGDVAGVLLASELVERLATRG